MACGNGRRNGRAGRRHILPFRPGELHGDFISGNNIHCRRDRHGHDSMPAPNRPCPFRKFRNNHLFDVKAVKSNGSRHHIHNGVERSHLMKMDFVKGQVMGFRFRFANNLEYFTGQRFCCFRHITGIDHRKNFRKPPMGMIMIFSLTAAVMCLPVMPFLMAMAVMFFSVRFLMTRASRSCRQGQIAVKIVHVMVMVLTVIIKMDMKITAVDARFLYSAYLYEKAVCRKRIQRFFKSVRIRPQVDHCRHEHIPADPGPAVQV